MAYTCEICGKVAVTGSSQKHKRGVAGKRWAKRTTSTSRLFKPNLQKVAVKINSESKGKIKLTDLVVKYTLDSLGKEENNFYE